MDPRSCRSIVVFGGSFDPPHRGHVELPRQAMQSIHADAVVYVPAGHSPFKDAAAQTPPEHRAAMLRMALRDQPHAVVLTDELDRTPSYTVDTLEALRDRLGPGVAMRLLIGSDQLRAFDRWKDYCRVVELAEPLVMIRRGATLGNLPDGFDRAAWQRRVVELPVMDISSTEIRRRVEADEPIDHLVCPAVARYIAERQLYRRASE